MAAQKPSTIIGMTCPTCETHNSIVVERLEDDFGNEYEEYTCKSCNVTWLNDLPLHGESC